MSISAQLAPLLTLSLLPLAAMAQTTGVMSFMNSHAGVVYEKDLGPNTDAVARHDALRSRRKLAQGVHPLTLLSTVRTRRLAVSRQFRPRDRGSTLNDRFPAARSAN